MDVQLEEGIRYLQHKNMWVIVFMADKDALASSSHAMIIVMFF